jgi:hypothetical protein
MDVLGLFNIGIVEGTQFDFIGLPNSVSMGSVMPDQPPNFLR